MIDAIESFKWVKRKCGKNIQLIVSGGSAGGGMAHHVARYIRDGDYSDFKKEMLGIIGIAPWVCVDESLCPVKMDPEIAQSCLMLDGDSLEWFYNHCKDDYLVEYEKELWKSLDNLPPHYIVAIEFDPLKNQDIYFGESLLKEDNIHKLEIVKNEIHGLRLKNNSYFNEISKAIQFLEKKFKI